ncbi:unnamed protein product [Ostreobium quekettii]|uniref:Uncharacterized protein n=1 Tax=Ostreobium quekettii TaxID=121088 RepID=A0A8S1J6E8_9CHLO|nr:unnamed protein product [Ostreobium quekettii]|eukprot:evm.model.scf_2054.4 EVM.evm.TU.scf_2054.4   scf_2054:28383-29225(+)
MDDPGGGGLVRGGYGPACADDDLPGWLPRPGALELQEIGDLLELPNGEKGSPAGVYPGPEPAAEHRGCPPNCMPIPGRIGAMDDGRPAGSRPAPGGPHPSTPGRGFFVPGCRCGWRGRPHSPCDPPWHPPHPAPSSISCAHPPLRDRCLPRRPAPIVDLTTPYPYPYPPHSRLPPRRNGQIPFGVAAGPIGGIPVEPWDGSATALAVRRGPRFDRREVFSTVFRPFGMVKEAGPGPTLEDLNDAIRAQALGTEYEKFFWAPGAGGLDGARRRVAPGGWQR